MIDIAAHWEKMSDADKIKFLWEELLKMECKGAEALAENERLKKEINYMRSTGKWKQRREIGIQDGR